MKDFAVDPNGNRFLWRENGLRWTETYLEYMAQKARCALSLFLGEWYLNKHIGIPYIPDWAGGKDAHRAALETALITAIANIKGIKSLESFEPVFDAGKRELRVSFTARCENGETLEFSEELPVRRGGE
jgi:hypothetical protein